MWYTLRVKQEDQFCRWIQNREKQKENALIQECFFLQRERVKKFGGTFHKIQEIVFPQYVFLHTNQKQKVEQLLKNTPELQELLEVSQTHSYLTLLQPEEVTAILRWGNEEHLSELSVIRITKEKEIEILSGNLKDYKENIVKVNLHQRSAVVQIPLLGNKREVYMGFLIEGRDEQQDLINAKSL